MTVALYVFCLFKVVYSQSYPSSAYIPINAVSAVSFTCSGTAPLKWKVNGVLYDLGNPIPGINSGTVTDGMLLSQTLTVQNTSVVTLNGSSFQCTTKGDNFTSVPTAFIIVYGSPSEAGDLSSESVSDGVLVFSWSPPWAPDGVQLYYTVTVTNTNTNVVTAFNTSDTSITLNRDNTTSVNSSSSSSQCDQYVWSVTAVNPAGISVPANYTTPVSFVPAPGITKITKCTFDDSFTSIMIAIEPLQGFNYSIAEDNMCTNVTNESKNEFVIHQAHKCSNFTLFAEQNCVNGTVSVNIDTITTTCLSSSSPHSTTVTAVPSVPSPSVSSLPTTASSSGSVWIYIVVVVILLMLILVVLGSALIYWRWRIWKKTHTTCHDLPMTKSESEVLQICEGAEPPHEKKVSTLASMLPEYATPADARKAKEVELVKQSETSKRSMLKSLKKNLSSEAEYEVPSVTIPTPKVMDTAMYSEVFEPQKSHTSAPPLPPPPGPDDYTSLQHDTGQPGAQENNTYDIPQDGDAPHLYSSVEQPTQALKKFQYSELQHTSSSGDRVHGTINVVEYNVIGPKTDPPALPPPPSEEIVKEMNM